jgi:hypothetical protein
MFIRLVEEPLGTCLAEVCTQKFHVDIGDIWDKILDVPG